MYKLFLTLRYLTRKKIVIFPILVVWLCLMMMIIVTSIMGGFVDRVRQTNRDALSDIIIFSDNNTGWAGYDALQKALQKKFPEIDSSTPVARAFGLANLKSYGITRPVEITGIDPAAQAHVTRYQQTLYREYIAPHNAAKDFAARLPATAAELNTYMQSQVDKAEDALQKDRAVVMRLAAPDAPKPKPNYSWLAGLLVVAAIVAWILRPRPSRTGWSVVGAGAVAILGLAVVALGILWPLFFARQFELAEDRENRASQAVGRAYEGMRIAANLEALDSRDASAPRYTTQAQILQKILPKQPSFAIPPDADQDGKPPPVGCVVGVEVGFSPRDKRGNFNRMVSLNNDKLFITVFPVSQGGAVSTNTAYTLPFIIVDDSYSGVFSIDGEAVYAPFATVQLMAGMRPDPDVVATDPALAFPPRCNELLVRLKDDSDAEHVRILRQRIDKFVQDFRKNNAKLIPETLQVQTWDEHQARYLGAVENEKVMMTVITGIMSLVSLVVIFLIFYMIVRDKTRDIGIIKAIGGSEEGVAGIFLFYGLFIGLAGGILGLISGVAFVTHTNQIHEWIYQTTGIIIWDRSVYMFDRIPDTVHPKEVAVYFCLALLAGVIGALIPAIVAATEDPVKAVRYE